MDKEKKDKPKRIERPFLKKESGGFLQKKKEENVEEIQEFVLLLMRNKGTTEFLENVPAGEFYIVSEDGKEKKSIMLTPNKLTVIVYNKQYFRGWIAHEDNMSPYPEEPLHNAEMFKKVTQKLAMNYHDVNEATKMMAAKTKMILTIVGVIALVAYLAFIVMKNQGAFDPVVAEVAVEAAKNVSEVAKTTGVIVG